MIKSKVLNIAIFIACILSLFIASKSLYEKQNKCIELEQLIAIQTDSIKTITKVVEGVNLIQDCKIEDCSVTNTLTNKSLKLFTLLCKFSDVTIICKLIETGCGSCNKKQIGVLDYLQKFENLIILSHASNARQLRLFSSETKIKSTIYQLEPSQRLFYDDDNTKVVVMYVNKEGTILRAFLLNENTLFLLKNIVPDHLFIK